MGTNNRHDIDHRCALTQRTPIGTIFEIGHVDIPLTDWKAFRDAPPRALIEEVIDRSETELPEYCVPLGRSGGE